MPQKIPDRIDRGLSMFTLVKGKLRQVIPGSEVH
jgi:hypothetical protein